MLPRGYFDSSIGSSCSSEIFIGCSGKFLLVTKPAVHVEEACVDLDYRKGFVEWELVAKPPMVAGRSLDLTALANGC